MSRDFSARTFRLRYVSPQTMAFWLDPNNNAEPEIIARSRELQGLPSPKTTEAKEMSSVLPQGVKAVFPLVKQAEIVVVGFPEGLDKMAPLIEILDKNSRQIEIEVILVRTEAQNLKSFGLEFKNEEKTPQMGIVRGNFHAVLAALIASNRAKVERAPRVTAISNLATPIQFDLKKESSDLPSSSVVTFEKIGSIDLVVTPTINGDDSLTLMISAGEPKEIVVANVKDGETLALREIGVKLAPTDPKTPRLRACLHGFL